MSDTADVSMATSHVPIVSSEAAAFEAFFEQERDGLYRALWLVTRNRYEAEELTQDAFVRVLERWDSVSAMQNPRGYLYRAAMNAFRTGYRRALLATKRSIGVTPNDDAIAGIDERDAAVRALAGLSPRQRAAVVTGAIGPALSGRRADRAERPRPRVALGDAVRPVLGVGDRI